MDLFVELLQVALGTRDKLSRVPSAAEWGRLLEEAERQRTGGRVPVSRIIGVSNNQ